MDPENTPLARPGDWTLWWTAFKTMSQNLHVWQYIDPKGTLDLVRPVLPEVPKELSGTPSLVNGAVLLSSKEESYQRALRHFTGVTMPIYSAKMDRYALDRESLMQMEDFFVSTVSKKTYGSLLATKHTLRDKLRVLLNKVEPSTHSEMEDAYYTLDDLLAKNPAEEDFGTWSSQMRLALTRCESLQRTFPDVAHQVRDASRSTRQKSYTQNTGTMPEHRDFLTNEPAPLTSQSQPLRPEPAESVSLIDMDIEPLPELEPDTAQAQQSSIIQEQAVLTPTHPEATTELECEPELDPVDSHVEQPTAQPRNQTSSLSAKAAPFELSKPSSLPSKETESQKTSNTRPLQSAAANALEKRLAPTIFQLAAEEGEYIEDNADTNTDTNTATRRAMSPPRGRQTSSKSAPLSRREAEQELPRHASKRPAHARPSERRPERSSRELSAPARTRITMPCKTPFPATMTSGGRRPSASTRRSLSPRREASNANTVTVGRRRLPSLPLSSTYSGSGSKRKRPSTWEYRERCEWCNCLHVPEGETEHWRSCYFCVPERCPEGMRHILRDPKRVDAVRKKLSRRPVVQRAIASWQNNVAMRSWREEQDRKADPVDLAHSDSSYTAYSTENYMAPRSQSRSRRDNLDY